MNLSNSCCKIEDEDGVRLITFTRPEARNAFNDELRNGLEAGLIDAKENRDIKAVVLTGEGTALYGWH